MLGQISAAIVQVNQGAQSTSAQGQELSSTADELGGLADQLRQESARFKLRHANAGVSDGVAAQLTPEMMQALNQLLQQPKYTAPTPNAPVIKSHATAGNGKAVPVLDRDVRGYGQF
jgi:ABC-type transporter Mla subunit MlaD